ncbi:MAG TPA: putative sugar nucleotidyl transferase [Longimicrobiales bacterium]|nr:putative sugar nucleotidyl transferase [Longimicrobiales bacterium]
MTGARLYLFDDHGARRWAPFTLTRPAGELAFGAMLLRERTERAFGLPCAGHLTRPALAGFDEPGAPRVVEADDLPRDETRVLICSRAVLTRPVGALPRRTTRLAIEGRTIGWVVAPGEPVPPDEQLRFPGRNDDGSGEELAGHVLHNPWDLLAEGPARIAEDLRALALPDTAAPGVVRIGDEALTLGDGAGIEPGVVVDTRDGPIHLGDGVRVEGPGRLVGPLVVRPGSRILGGTVGSSFIGPVCKVRGEMADSILLGFVNKAHDGHLGHAVLGRWVNLGAMTTNSDLKNNYGSVRVWTLDGERDTGLLKVGCFLGDHVKTGIGTMINTGTVIGAGSNVFGGLMPPDVVPPFSWGSGTDLRDYRLDRFLEAAERAMVRRSQVLPDGMRALLSRAWSETRVRRAV